MSKAKSLPGAVWDERQQLWRVPRGAAAEAALADRGLDGLVIDHVIEHLPRYGYTKTAGDHPHASTGKLGPATITPTPRRRIPDADIAVEFDRLTALLEEEGRAVPTVRSYRSALKLFREWLEVPLPEAKPEEIRGYLDYCLEVRGHSVRTVNQTVNALKAYFERVLRGCWEGVGVRRCR